MVQYIWANLRNEFDPIDFVIGSYKKSTKYLERASHRFNFLHGRRKIDFENSF
jgi:hypothetical protein